VPGGRPTFVQLQRKTAAIEVGRVANNFGASIFALGIVAPLYCVGPRDCGNRAQR